MLQKANDLAQIRFFGHHASHANACHVVRRTARACRSMNNPHDRADVITSMRAMK